MGRLAANKGHWSHAKTQSRKAKSPKCGGALRSMMAGGDARPTNALFWFPSFAWEPYFFRQAALGAIPPAKQSLAKKGVPKYNLGTRKESLRQKGDLGGLSRRLSNPPCPPLEKGGKSALQLLLQLLNLPVPAVVAHLLGSSPGDGQGLAGLHLIPWARWRRAYSRWAVGLIEPHAAPLAHLQGLLQVPVGRRPVLTWPERRPPGPGGPALNGAAFQPAGESQPLRQNAPRPGPGPPHLLQAIGPDRPAQGEVVQADVLEPLLLSRLYRASV